jgi:hypothetical protein
MASISSKAVVWILVSFILLWIVLIPLIVALAYGENAGNAIIQMLTPWKAGCPSEGEKGSYTTQQKALILELVNATVTADDTNAVKATCSDNTKALEAVKTITEQLDFYPLIKQLMADDPAASQDLVTQMVTIIKNKCP